VARKDNRVADQTFGWRQNEAVLNLPSECGELRQPRRRCRQWANAAAVQANGSGLESISRRTGLAWWRT